MHFTDAYSDFHAAPSPSNPHQPTCPIFTNAHTPEVCIDPPLRHTHISMSASPPPLTHSSLFPGPWRSPRVIPLLPNTGACPCIVSTTQLMWHPSVSIKDETRGHRRTNTRHFINNITMRAGLRRQRFFLACRRLMPSRTPYNI